MTVRRSHDSVSIDIAAPPEEVYALVSDITRMGEWSPETRSCRWARGATGPTVGARFKARNKGRRWPSWFNTPTVTAADPGREFAFNRSGPGMGSYTWRYHLEPTESGTKLTESYDAEPPVPRVMRRLTEKWVGSSDRRCGPTRRHGDDAPAHQSRGRVLLMLTLADTRFAGTARTERGQRRDCT